MVGGTAFAVTKLPRVYQWADSERIARGRGSAAPSARHAAVAALLASAFVGLPWPMNTAGMRAGGVVTAEPLAAFEGGARLKWGRERRLQWPPPVPRRP